MNLDFASAGNVVLWVAIVAGRSQTNRKFLLFVNQTRSCLFKKTNVPSVNTIALTECEKVRRRLVR